MSASPLSDKRCSTRLPVELTAALGRLNQEEEHQWPSKITNLNATGLQLECSHKTLLELMPNITRPDPNSPIEISVQFKLPGDSSDIKARCSMMYVRRLAKDRFLSGGRFIKMSGEHQQQLQQYLSNQPGYQL